MLLLGALFALFGAGFWLCCLTDVALTPRRECRALPKTAWIVLVAATFVAGAVVWLAFRRPAQLTGSPAPSGRDTDDLPPQAPERRDPSLRGPRPRPQARNRAGGPQPGHLGRMRGGPGVTRSGFRDGQSGPDAAAGDSAAGRRVTHTAGTARACAAARKRRPRCSGIRPRGHARATPPARPGRWGQTTTLSFCAP